MFSLTLSTTTLLLVSFAAFVFPFNPVILVPGDGGSRLEAEIKVRSLTCETRAKFALWVNIKQLISAHCFVDTMSLVYNETTHTTHDSPGVTVQVPDFGNTNAVEFLDRSRESSTAYYHQIIERLTEACFARNFSVRGAPYDFRRAPNEFHDFFGRLEKLILETYEANNNIKVILICHSMGSPTMLYFLNHKTQAWKDKYIRSLVTISGPWGGAVKALRFLVSGEKFLDISALLFRKYQRSAPSTAWFMPFDTFWGEDEILISRPGRNYTVKDYKQLFNDLNDTTSYMMREDTENLVKEMTPPGVEVFCIHGVNVSTQERLHFHKGFPDEQPTITYGDGDGTVNLRSLLGCLRWKDKQPQPVHHYMIHGADHVNILKNKKLLDYLATKVLRLNTAQKSQISFFLLFLIIFRMGLVEH